MSTIVTCKYIVTATSGDNHHTIQWFNLDQKELAWKTAKLLAGTTEHATYELVNPSASPSTVNSVRWFNGESYEHTVANAEAEKCQIPGCEGTIFVPHYGSRLCKSGRRPHCTCDSCY